MIPANSQVQYGGDIRQHIEMAALNPDSRTILMVEAKEAQSGEQARSLGERLVSTATAEVTNKWGNYSRVSFKLRMFAEHCLE